MLSDMSAMRRVGVKAMKQFRWKFAGAVTAGALSCCDGGTSGYRRRQAARPHSWPCAEPGRPAGDAGRGEVHDRKEPELAGTKFRLRFPLDASGNYKGTGIKRRQLHGRGVSGWPQVDFMPQWLAPGEDKSVDFDMTRKEYIDKMSPADKAALEEYKKNAAATMAANAKIANLNALLASGAHGTKAGNYDAAIKGMTDATTAKPDEPILWETLGDAQLGQANAADKAA